MWFLIKMIFDTVIYLKETSSTMDISRQFVSTLKPPFVVVAETQLFGKGRRNKKWLSPKGGLWLTEVLYTKKFWGLSLFISIPILRVLKRYVREIKVKWPNDLFLCNRKVAGILIERTQDVAFIGIGINIENDIPEEAKEFAISLKEKKNVNRIKIFKEISEEEEKILPIFQQSGFAPFREEYEDSLMIMNKNIAVKSKKIVQGKVLGVTEFGELVLKTVYGMEKIAQGTVLSL